MLSKLIGTSLGLPSNALLAQIFFPNELEHLLRALLKARGSYLTRLGNEGRKALNRINVEDVRKVIKGLRKY